MFKKIAKNAMNSFSGKARYQRLFARLHRIALKGMNIGEGALLQNDGELCALQLIKKELVKNKRVPYIIFDVGANIGEYTEKISAIFNDVATKIFSFEPSGKTFEKLKSCIGNKQNVSLHNIALGEKNSTLTLYSDKEGSGLASLHKRRLDHFNLKLDKEEEIQVETLDGFCRKNNIMHIHLLKMDVEGHELSVLRGAENMMSSDSIDFIQFEFGGSNIDSRTYFQDFFYLLSPNYHLYRIVKDGIFPISRYDETLEIFMTTNFLAKRKDFQKTA